MLEVSWKYDEAKKNIAVTISQKQEKAFEFPLELGISTGSGVQKKVVTVKEKAMTITISSAKKPDNVVLDPDMKLLFEERKN